MRSRLTSASAAVHPRPPAGCPRWGGRPLLLVLLLGLLNSSPAAWAQGAASKATPVAAADSGAAPAATATAPPAATSMAPAATTITAPSTATVAPAAKTAAAPASNWTVLWAVLGGVAIGALGVWFFVRKTPTASPTVPAPAPDATPEPARKKPAANVQKSSPAEPAPAENAGKGITVQSMRAAQGTPPNPAAKPTGKDKRTKPNYNSRHAPAAPSPEAWPTIAPRPSAMNPTSPASPPADDNAPLEPGQTVEWAAPTSTPPAIQELIEATVPPATATPAAAPDANATPSAAGNGPVHYYAPAPDVPSIEHRKLSPNPLPQMPVLITLPNAEATTAQYSFSPQADQSRIIGNGVRELKEFFQFELPPTEQFTSIKNLTPGRLEKRDDAWHVVQKAEIALS